MAEKTVKRVNATIELLKDRLAAGEPIDPVEPTDKLKTVLQTIGCDVADPRYVPVSILLLSAHFTPRFKPDWATNGGPRKWKPEKRAELLLDYLPLKTRNPRLSAQDASRWLSKKTKWKTKRVDGSDTSLRKRVAKAIRDPDIWTLAEEKLEERWTRRFGDVSPIDEPRGIMIVVDGKAFTIVELAWNNLVKEMELDPDIAARCRTMMAKLERLGEQPDKHGPVWFDRGERLARRRRLKRAKMKRGRAGRQPSKRRSSKPKRAKSRR